MVIPINMVLHNRGISNRIGSCIVLQASYICLILVTKYGLSSPVKSDPKNKIQQYIIYKIFIQYKICAMRMAEIWLGHFGKFTISISYKILFV